MRIVHVCCANFYRDNCGYQENILPKYHVKRGLETFVIASLVNKDMKNNENFYDKPREYWVDGYKVIRIPYKLGLIGRKLRLYKGLYYKLQQIKPDIIFVHGVQFLDIRAVKKYMENNNNVKLYIDNHGDYFNGAKTWVSKNIMHKIIWKSGAKIIEPHTEMFYGVTPIRCDFLQDMYNVERDKIDLLVMGADSDKINFKNRDLIRSEIRSQLNISNEDFVLISGGRLVNRKNIPDLLAAVNELHKQNRKFKLILFGPMSKEIKEEIRALLDSPAIRYIPWINSDEVYNFFLASDLGVFPGTHSVLWEQAVGTGLPCVFKYWKGMQHVDLGGNSVFITDVNKKSIKETIESILDKDKFSTMEKVAIDKGIAYFSYDSIATRAIGLERKN